MFHTKNPKRLSISVITFVLIIIIGFITMNRPEHFYKATPAELMESIMALEGEITPEEAIYYAEENDPWFVFIDIRNQYEYIKGHIPNAINIPLTELLTEETLKQFDSYVEDSISIVMYGNSQTDANAPWMMLKLLGYKDVKLMLGGYEYYAKDPSEIDVMADMPEYYVEIAKYDFAAIVSEASLNVEESQTEASEPVIPVRKKKKTIASGGC